MNTTTRLSLRCLTRAIVTKRSSHVCSLAHSTSSTTTGVTFPTTIIASSRRPNHLHCTKLWLSSSSFQNNHKFLTKAFKDMLKPFYLKCHPDVQSSSVAKRVNLRAIQNLHAYLGLVENVLSGKKVEWPPLMTIEFLWTIQPHHAKKKKQSTTTRRRVELVMPCIQLLQALQPQDASRPRAVAKLQRHVRMELEKVLRVAGLPVVSNPIPEEEDYSEDEMWQEEMSFLEKNQVSNNNATTRRFGNHLVRPRKQDDSSRRRFVQSLQHDQLRKVYQEAFLDAEMDLQTTGWIQNDFKRKQHYVNSIMARVRVLDDKISILDQLSTLRRLSLVLMDHFEELQMEEMGACWDVLVVVLIPMRTTSRRQRRVESGFRFTLDQHQKVMVHVPMDFGPSELVREFQSNLEDFYNLIATSQNVFYQQDLIPKWV